MEGLRSVHAPVPCLSDFQFEIDKEIEVVVDFCLCKVRLALMIFLVQINEFIRLVGLPANGKQGDRKFLFDRRLAQRLGVGYQKDWYERFLHE